MADLRIPITMAASENDSGTLADRMAAIQRRIEKSDKPKTLYNPSNPTSNFDLIRLSIKLKAEALGLQFFYDCPSRPSSNRRRTTGRVLSFCGVSLQKR